MRRLPISGVQFLMLAVFIALGTLTAQQLAITGRVLDPSNKGVPGAIVTLAGKSGSHGQTTSDLQGIFRFDALPGGDYEIVVVREGFKPATLNVRLPRRASTPMPVRLSLADLQQQVTVADPGSGINSNTADNLDVIKLDRAALENLPSLGQDYVGSVARFLDAASVGTAGADVIVDGMPTSERGVSASAIQEIRINQNPYSAEYARQGRSRIEIITSPGATAYHGAFNFLLRDYRLDARNPFAQSRPQEQRRTFEGSFTGPIGDGKKTSFLVSANYEQFDLVQVIFARTLAGELRQNFPAPARNAFVSARLNRQLNQANQFSLRYEFTDDSVHGAGAGGFVLPESSADSTNREHHVYVQLRSVITPRVLNEFQLRTGRHNNLTISGLQDTTRIVVLDSFTGGGAQADRRSTENHFQFHNMLSWTAGKHLIKTGVSSPDMSRRGLNDRTNSTGVWTFSSLDDYRLGRPFSFARQQGNGHMVIWEQILGVFINDDFRVHKNLSLSLGARWDWQNFIPDAVNFSPRAALAWAPGGSRKTVLRSGAGMFYDRTGPRPMLDSIRYDGTHLRDVLIENPQSYPNLPDGIGLLPQNLTRFGRGVRLPYAIQYSLSVERQLRKSASLSATYIGTTGISQFRSRDVNAPYSSFFVRPDPRVGILREFESSGRQTGDALEVTLRGSATKYFTGTAQYVLGRTRNDTGGIYWMPAYNYDFGPEWGRADFDERHRFNLAGTLKVNTWLNLGLLFSANSGRPYNITTGFDANRDGFANDRPSGVARNTGQGPNQATLDVRWAHDFVLSKAKKEKGPIVTFAMEGFNVLNRVNYVTFVGTQSSSFFGQPVAARPARRMQGSVRFRF